MPTAAKTKSKTPIATDEDLPDTAGNPRFRTVSRGKSRYADKRLELPLSGVRKAVGKTQVDVSTASGIDQGDVSRLERRDLDDVQIGTLRKYLRGIGVELELVAIAGSARIIIRPTGDE